MCARTNRPPTLACTLRDLQPGQKFHDPNGEVWMAVKADRTEDSTMVVNLGNGATNQFGMTNDELRGTITPMYSDLKLGYDHKGVLYASTYLNGWYCEADPVAETAVEMVEQLCSSDGTVIQQKVDGVWIDV